MAFLEYPYLLLCAYTFAAAIFDLKSRKIPNWLNLAAAAAAVVMTLLLSVPLVEVVAGGSAGFVIFLVLYLLGIVGGGDVKMMGVAGMMIGFPAILQFLLVACILSSAGGLVFLILAGKGKWLLRDLLKVGHVILSFLSFGRHQFNSTDVGGGEQEPMLNSPFAPGVFAASLLILFVPFTTLGLGG